MTVGEAKNIARQWVEEHRVYVAKWFRPPAPNYMTAAPE
jgi:hypothetical protein